MIPLGKAINIDDLSNLPNVSMAVAGWLHETNAGIIQKQQVDGYTQEVAIWKPTKVNVQPMNESMSVLKEGERSWKWYVIYTVADLDLKTDEIFLVFNSQYRIMSKRNWSHHGFIEYHAIEDYTKDYYNAS